MSDKIMIVEDDTDLNQLLTDILTDANYQTIQAYSGTEAMLLLQMERPDLMLLDLMLQENLVKSYYMKSMKVIM